MPSYSCVCDARINDSSIPNDYGFHLYTEDCQEYLVDKLVELHKKNDSDSDFEQEAYHLVSGVKGPIIRILECKTCGRLIVLEKKTGNILLWFKPDKTLNESPPSLRSVFKSVNE